MAWLERQGKFQFYDVTTWLTNNNNPHIAQYIHLLPNILKSKGTVTFDQSIEYSIIKKNYTQNVVEKPFPEPFRKNQNWAYF